MLSEYKSVSCAIWFARLRENRFSRNDFLFFFPRFHIELFSSNAFSKLRFKSFSDSWDSENSSSVERRSSAALAGRSPTGDDRGPGFPPAAFATLSHCVLASRFFFGKCNRILGLDSSPVSSHAAAGLGSSGISFSRSTCDERRLRGGPSAISYLSLRPSSADSDGITISMMCSLDLTELFLTIWAEQHSRSLRSSQCPPPSHLKTMAGP